MVECTGCALPSSTWAASGTLACAHPIAAYCDQTQTPIPAWVAPGCPPATWVELLASERATGWPPLYEECDTFDVAYAGWSCGGNSVVTFFYDKASGNLTAAVQFDGAGHPGEQTCLAGPASFDAASLRAAGCVPHQCFPADAGLQSPSCDLDASSGD